MRRGRTGGCTGTGEQIIAQRLATLPRWPFHIAIDLSITNTPTEVAALFNGFQLALLAQGSLDYY